MTDFKDLFWKCLETEINDFYEKPSKSVFALECTTYEVSDTILFTLVKNIKFGHKLCGSASPTPSRETNNSSAKGKASKGGKGGAKGKNASDMSVTSEPITPTEDEKMDPELAIQQVYISTPAGLNIRFGKNLVQIVFQKIFAIFVGIFRGQNSLTFLNFMKIL